MNTAIRRRQVCSTAHGEDQRDWCGQSPGKSRGKSVRAFNAKAFLDSSGLQKKIVRYGRDEIIFTQGDPCDDVLYIQDGRREAVGALEDRPGSGGRDARPRRLLRRRMPGGPAGPDGQRDRDHAEHRARDRQDEDGPAAAQAARAVGSLHRAHAVAQRPHRGGPDRSAVQLEREAAGAHAVAAGALRQAGQAERRSCRRSRRRRSRKWSARRARA